MSFRVRLKHSRVVGWSFEASGMFLREPGVTFLNHLSAYVAVFRTSSSDLFSECQDHAG